MNVPSMHIAIIAPGSRGDVQPYVALGKGLNKAGNDVRLVGKGSKERFVNLGRCALSAAWLYVKKEHPRPAQLEQEMPFPEHSDCP